MKLRRRKRQPGIDMARVGRFLPSRPVIVEAGAADGADAANLARIFRDGRIHAFEPEPASFETLTARVAQLGNVTCWNLALGPTDGDTVLHVSSGPYGAQSSSTLSPKRHLLEMPDVKFDDDVTVRQMKLSTWAAENNVERVDALTLDMQGLERDMLAASADFASQATVIVSEVFGDEEFEGCATVTEMQALLSELGFVVLETNMYWGNSGDVLAVHRRKFQAD